MSYTDKLRKTIDELTIEKHCTFNRDEKIAIENEIAVLYRELINFQNMR